MGSPTDMIATSNRQDQFTDRCLRGSDAGLGTASAAQGALHCRASTALAWAWAHGHRLPRRSSRPDARDRAATGAAAGHTPRLQSAMPQLGGGATSGPKAVQWPDVHDCQVHRRPLDNQRAVSRCPEDGPRPQVRDQLKQGCGAVFVYSSLRLLSNTKKQAH